MHNSCVAIALNSTLLIALDLWNILTFYDMYKNLHFHQILHHSKPVVPNFKLDKTYLPKGYLILEIPGMVNTDYVYYQNSPLFCTGLMLGTTLSIFWKWKLRRLRVEKWVLVFHIITSFVFWYDFIFLSVSNGLWDFPRTNRPHIIIQVMAPDLKHILIASLHFSPYLSKQMFGYAVLTVLYFATFFIFIL